MSGLPPTAQARVKACAASVAIILIGYTAVSVITDRSRLQKALNEQAAALEAAQQTIRELQSQPKISDYERLPRRIRRRKKLLEADDDDDGLAPPPPPAVSSADAELLRAASVITSPTCRASWIAEQRAAASGPASPHTAPKPYAGGDLELPGVLEAALAARAPDHELIFLSVGDTRDHRRQYKDPSLRTISIDFLRNLLANLKRLRIGHYLILTTEPLCKRLQQDYCEWSCAWTTMWHTHPGLPKWNLKPGDMFLMWAQQWRYISQAMERGYRVLRSDTDVYLAEDPYPILRGPLFDRFQMVVQHDFFGARERPKCDRGNRPAISGGADDKLPTCGFRPAGLALLNIGLVYLRSIPGGGVHAVINQTWARFLERLSGPPSKPPHLNGAVDSQALIDQPFMRSVVNDLAVPDKARFSPPKYRPDQWAVVPGAAGATLYAEGSRCALPPGENCDEIAAERKKT